MNPEIVPIHMKESLIVDGILFVRTTSIFETMVNAHLIFAGLIILVIVMPIHASFSSTRTLDLIIYSDGSTHVTTKIDVDPSVPDFEVKLVGSSIDNFVAVGDTGFLLAQNIIADTARINTLGSSSITVDYDVYDLISKEGRIWIFKFDSPSDYTLLMPKNSVIVGMSALPKNMVVVDNQTRLELNSGPSEISYISGTPSNPVVTKPSIVNDNSLDYVITVIIGSSISVVIGAVFILKRKQSKSLPLTRQVESSNDKQNEIKSVDTDNIFSLRPEMREDDKEIVRFISKNGGQVLESELRKKFLQPRTTMWRAVKRLERLGVVEITKKDLQNMVVLKKELEEEK
jgi:uncharacterized membrane protein